MKITRRAFGKLSSSGLAILLLGASAFTEGCTSFGAILAWVSVGLNSFQSVIDLLAGAGVISVFASSALDLIIKAVKAGIADIGTAVDAYNVAPDINKATALGRIGTALMVAQNSIAQFWNDLTIPDPRIASLTAGLLGIIVSTLAGFQTQVPPPATVQARQFPKVLAIRPQSRSIGQFRKDFNDLLVGSGYPQFQIR